MVLRPDTDPITGQLRLIGDNTPEAIKLFPGELGVFSLGAFLLGGDDTVEGSSDSELIYGNRENDQLFGGGGNDTLLGGQENDQILGDEGNDLLFGEAGNDQFVGFVDPDNKNQLLGIEGDDTIYSGSGEDQVRENDGNDVIFGGQGNDELRAGIGNDFIQGNEGNDFIGAEDGDDTISGGGENDQVRGDEGNDLVEGNAGDDQLSGQSGNDTLFGGQGNDQIIGEAGDDRLYGNQGTDTLIGGEGKDIFVLDADNLGVTAEFSDLIVDYQPGEDILFLTGDLGFENLTINPDPRTEKSTILQANNDGIVAVLQGVEPQQINRSNFVIPGVVAFSSNQFQVNEDGTAINPITVVRNSGSDGAVSVTVVPVRTPLTPPPNEININPIVVNFANGDTTPKTINIPVVNDNIPDYSANLLLTLEDPTNFAELGTPNEAVLEIIEDETRPSEVGTLLNPIPQNSAQFGATLSRVGNNFVAVGAPGNQGIAYLFDITANQPILTFRNPSPNAGNSRFGQSIATILGDNIAIAAPEDSSLAPGTGTVYLFSTATGTSYQRLNNPTPEPFDLFGFSIASLGDNILVGAPSDNTSAIQGGIAYLFDGNTGQLLQTFLNPNPQTNDFFGASIVAVGDKVLIGAPGSLTVGGGEQPGEAYIFDSTTGQLLQTFKNPISGLDNFGWSLAWTGIGRDILVGAPGDDQQGIDTGTAFLLDGITGAVLQTYNAPKAESYNQFGYSLGLIGNDVLIGSPGYGLLNYGGSFRYQFRTGNLVQTYLNPIADNSDTDLNFGASISSVGNRVLIGAPNFDSQFSSVGAVYEFL